MSVAVFDVDKTLTMRDCVVPFVTKVAGPAKVAVSIVRHLPEVLKLVARRDRDGLKLLFVRELFAGKNAETVEEVGVEFAAHIASNWMREDIAARLRWHQAEGHVVLLVSASLDSYLVPLGDLLEVDAVLCSTLEQVNGEYTGALVGANCRGVEKVNRIRAWCDESGVALSNVRYAYGDSSGDEPMLSLAEFPEWVGKNDVERFATSD